MGAAGGGGGGGPGQLGSSSQEPALIRPQGGDRCTDFDTATVRGLLGRDPKARFEVGVRGLDGRPLVIRNEPFTLAGEPMPTRWWLLDADLVRSVSQLEAAGGVREAERDVDAEALCEAHRRYARERDADIPEWWTGPRPAGGVGGTRRGVKCLHAHYAWYLAGGDDPVGDWTARRLRTAGGALSGDPFGAVGRHRMPANG